MKIHYLRKIFLVLFLDLLAYSSIIPLLPFLFLESNFFLSDYSSTQKVLYLSLLYAVYPLFQTLAAPFWSKVADKIGRKSMLQIAFLGNLAGYLISSLGIYYGQWKFLILGNAIAGCLGVNLSTINALISDFAEGVKRRRYFGLVNLVLGLAFAIGPFLSSHLIPKVPHIETVALFVFVLAAVVAVINLAIVSSIKQPLPGCVEPLKETLDLKGIKKEAFYPLLIIFLTTFGWYIFIKTFQVFLISSGLYSPKKVLQLVAFYGVSTVIAQAAFVTQFYKKFNYQWGLGLSLIGLASSMGLFVLQPKFMGAYIPIVAIAFFQSMISPHLLGFFSRNHSPEIHGKMMSAHLGIVSLAKIMAPAISGLIMTLSPKISLMTGASVILTAFLMLPLLFRKQASQEFKV
jgi:MFS family permease